MVNNSEKNDYAIKKELLETKQELLDKLVSKAEFLREIGRVDGSIELTANQVGKNTLEIQKLRGEMNGKFAEMSVRFSDIDDRFAEMNDKFNMVLTAIDGLSGQISDSSTEKAAGEHTFRRHDRKLDDHEKRITQLEKKAV